MSIRVASLFVVTLLVGLSTTVSAAEKADQPHPDWPVIYSDDFESDSTDKYQPTDPKAWKITKDGPTKAYSLFGKSNYKPAVRSPRNISLIKDLVVTDFVLDIKMKSTNKEYGHRDLCLFLGHQDPSHFYYIHIATKADPHAHSIFLVNDKPRVSIVKDGDRTKGVKWSDTYHHIRVIRETETGLIRVYFDDMKKPIMTATDKHFTHGRIGMGSFDDIGNFDDLVIRGKRYKE